MVSQTYMALALVTLAVASYSVYLANPWAHALFPAPVESRIGQMMRFHADQHSGVGEPLNDVPNHMYGVVPGMVSDKVFESMTDTAIRDVVVSTSPATSSEGTLAFISTCTSTDEAFSEPSEAPSRMKSHNHCIANFEALLASAAQSSTTLATSLFQFLNKCHLYQPSGMIYSLRLSEMIKFDNAALSSRLSAVADEIYASVRLAHSHALDVEQKELACMRYADEMLNLCANLQSEGGGLDISNQHIVVDYTQCFLASIELVTDALNTEKKLYHLHGTLIPETFEAFTDSSVYVASLDKRIIMTPSEEWWQFASDFGEALKGASLSDEKLKSLERALTEFEACKIRLQGGKVMHQPLEVLCGKV